VLEGFCSRLACRHIAEQDRRDLEELACQLDEQICTLRPDSYAILGPLEWKFHGTISVLSGNSSLIRALDGQQFLFRIFRESFVRLDCFIDAPISLKTMPKY